MSTRSADVSEFDGMSDDHCAALHQIAEARRILIAVTRDDGSMLSPIALSDAVLKAIEALGGWDE